MTPKKETLRPCPEFWTIENLTSASPYAIQGQYDLLRAENEKLKSALNKICSVTQFDHPTSQIIGSEEYEGAWLDCVEIAKEALAGSK